MNREEILLKIEDVVKNITGNDLLSLNLDSTAQDVAGWDSMAHINIILDLEDAFSTKFSIGELQNLNRIADLIQLIEIKSTRG